MKSMSRRWSLQLPSHRGERQALFLRRHAGIEGIGAAVPDGVPRWRAHARRLYATVTDRVRVAAALLTSRKPGAPGGRPLGDRRDKGPVDGTPRLCPPPPPPPAGPAPPPAAQARMLRRSRHEKVARNRRPSH